MRAFCKRLVVHLGRFEAMVTRHPFAILYKQPQGNSPPTDIVQGFPTGFWMNSYLGRCLASWFFY